MRHTVGADRSYLALISAGRVPGISEEDEQGMGMPELREVMEQNAAGWTTVLEDEPDADRVVVRQRDDGSEAHAPLGVRLAQVVHHGTDHRSQVCTALTSLGIEPPEIDVWAWAEAVGRFREVAAPA
jgi:uncharacterized damage-inducible protein DinB